MIVRDSPYELVVVSADADVQKFIERLLERGQERGCISPFRWRSERNALRDTLVSRPETAFKAFQPNPSGGVVCRFILVWDYQGCGRESQSAEDVESEVTKRLVACGIDSSDLATICIQPEFEVVFSPRRVWDKVRDELASKRNMLPPDDDAVIRCAKAIQRKRARSVNIPDDLESAMQDCPKEILEGLLSYTNLRASPALFEELANGVSIPAVKQVPFANRIAQKLTEWFPPEHGLSVQGCLWGSDGMD